MSRRDRRSRAAFLTFVACLAVTGCVAAAGPSEEVTDVRGTWRFTADQSAPALQLTGALVIETQQGGWISGRISWEERDGSGATRAEGGAVSGRVLDGSDVDFDVLLAGGLRRHVGRLRADTLSGSWLQVSNGRAGAFRAVRGTAGALP